MYGELMSQDAIAGLGLGIGFSASVIALQIVYMYAVRLVTRGLEEGGE